ncbi:AvaI/BsoBI family type II restriction endonuclease [Candidatus Methanoperedens nitratireducens]|uniref:Type-2 restriction enzyme AvaI n=1 Tax=Candidatus Methanoperedens nitratireducens TaxID=1392998 RepID=A0A284VJ59_9EURY|nr:AvaI/BsoBI family type II restriction endonuclease [Candidatus Methanoperedens nitroreducens]SNQ59280.1 Type-2 restriction enzyme AvaI [Candidatus Methanoperedens nitroreducens]
MPTDKPHRQHLTNSKSLITTYEETRAGFVALALEKNRRATPLIEEARSLKAAASKISTPASLINIAGIQAALLTAAGVSNKAAGHMEPADQKEAIQGLIKQFLEPAGPDFVEELVFRFLLTRGDALGGSMRNVGGALAQRKLTRAIIATLSVAGISYDWFSTKSNTWIHGTEDDPDIELDATGLSWSSGGQNRSVRYNLTVPFLKKNVDLCLFNCRCQELSISYGNPALYIALGELKGGIDPAGADEHWKTSRTSLSRIRLVFADRGLSPHLFFVGAAIENSMAEEIWLQLEDGTLCNAANLTDANQVASLCRWLCNL